MTVFWTALAFKATLWALILGLAAIAVPAAYPRGRRALALVGIWGLWLLPWLPEVPATEFHAGLSIPLPVPAGVAQPWLVWAWASGGFIAMLRLLREALHLAACARKAEKDRIGDAEVHFSAQVAGPCMAGWLRPRVYLPMEARNWPPSSLRAALRHELQHVRQHDGLHRAAAAVLRSLFWWNPAVHALCSIYENESEVCCDLEAADGVMSRHAYGHLLLAHACGGQVKALAPLFAWRSGLRKRIERLVARRRESRWRLAARWMIVTAVLGLGGVTMASIRWSSEASVPGVSAEQQEALLRLQADPFPAAF
jgi:hypothetical protein